MVKVYVDRETSTTIDEWVYTNADGLEESVNFCGDGLIDITTSCTQSITVYVVDIPKLILALQAAYDNEGGE